MIGSCFQPKFHIPDIRFKVLLPERLDDACMAAAKVGIHQIQMMVQTLP